LFHWTIVPIDEFVLEEDVSLLDQFPSESFDLENDETPTVVGLAFAMARLVRNNMNKASFTSRQSIERTIMRDTTS
jgi:hypothetical protein